MSKWRDATDDQPDDGIIVLCALNDDEVSEPVWLGYLDAGIWYTVEGIAITPTHWMDLPEPPN